MCNFIKMYFNGIARLRRAMPSFGATRRLIGEEAHALKFVTWQLVGDCLQRACIVCRSDTIGTICAAVEKRTEMHGGQCTIFLDACFDPHLYRVSSAMKEKYFLTSTGDFDGTACAAREFAGANFMR